MAGRLEGRKDGEDIKAAMEMKTEGKRVTDDSTQ